MNENIADLFKAVRKFNGLQQAEMATILGITQGTISKIEAATTSIELTLWFKFVSTFQIKDPYCFEYKAVELAKLDTIDILKFDSPLFPKHPYKVSYFGHKKCFVSKDIRPIFDFVQKNAPDHLKEKLKHFKISDESIFYIHNHPLPQFLIGEIFSILKILLADKEIEKERFLFDSSFGYSSHSPQLKNFSEQMSFLQSQLRWGNYTYLSDNSYRVEINNKDMASINSVEKNSKILLQYFILIPFFFHVSLGKKLHNSDVKLTKKWESWEIQF